MGFADFLGNDRMKENLLQAIRSGHSSHFYVISGPRGSGKRTLARLLTAALLCQEKDAPCGVCRHCRKALAGTHPDVSTVDDPEKKTVPVDLIRQARSELFVQPNEAARKILLFPRGQDMGIPSQNALLKVLEEPPSYGVFLLLTDNPQKLLPTVRSRCVELALQPLPSALLRQQLQRQFPQSQAIEAAIARSGGFLGQAQELLREGESTETVQFARCYGQRDAYGLLQLLVPMEKWKRDALIPQLHQWVQLLADALSSRSGIPSAYGPLLGTGRSSQELMQAIEHLQTAIQYAQGNVSSAAICGWLSWVLR